MNGTELYFELLWHNAKTDRPSQSFEYGRLIVAYKHTGGDIHYYVISYSKKHDVFNALDCEDKPNSAFENENVIAWAFLPKTEFFDDFKENEDVK